MLLTISAYAKDTTYCPQHSGYINVGMSVGQVIAACGQPLSRRLSNTPVTIKVPVTELIYTNLNTGSIYPGLNAAYYDQWSLPSGTQGITVEVSIIHNKVSSIKVNGAGSNAMSMCQGKGIQVGDPQGSVYSACGQPGMVNNTYVNQVVPSTKKPEVWIYQVDRYQPPISLTFLDGKLQSID